MIRTVTRWFVGSLLGICAVLALTEIGHAQNWTRFRGDNGTGISTQKGIPVTFSPGDLAWNIKLPGVGHSSPVIWKDRLFVTSAIDEGAVRYLFCLDAETGERIWARSVGLNRSKKHAKSSWASSTPTVDSTHVYVAFGDKENNTLTAFDFQGDVVWRRNLGSFESQHGQGVSPILFENLVILPDLQKGPSSVIALDRKTGRTVWSSAHKFYKTSYATPIIFQKKGEATQLICASGALGLASLDPRTGKLNWSTGEFPAPRRTVASPVVANGVIIQSCGGGGKGNVLIAVDPSEPHKRDKNRILYKGRKPLPYVPTPVAYKGHFYLWNDNGTVSCMVAKTGKLMWTKRIGGKFSGSPICIDGKLYAMNENGDVVVIAASPQYKFLGKTPLGDSSYATPAIANGRLYLRTFGRLACLKAEN